MGVTEGLRVGLPLNEVRTLLRGWKEALPSAVLSPDKTHLFYTIDFRPPANSTERRLRLTFDNGKLFIWGEPADPDIGQDPAAAGRFLHSTICAMFAVLEFREWRCVTRGLPPANHGDQSLARYGLKQAVAESPLCGIVPQLSVTVSVLHVERAACPDGC